MRSAATDPADRQRSPSRPASALGRIRLRHLQCFVAIAQLGTLRAAAQAMSVSQPAVTKTLGELEDLLGARLFVRGRRGAAPTAEAERFLPHALASVDALSRAVDSVAHGPAEAPLRIGMLPTVAPFLARVLQAFGAGRGTAGLRVGLRVHSGRNAQLIAWLRNGELDAAIGRLSDLDAMAGITFEPLYAEPMLIALRPGHPLADGHAPPPDALSACPLLLPPAGTLIRQVADGYLARHGIVPRAGWVETLDTAFARALALGGDHLWFTPAGAVRDDIDSGTLARLPQEITPHEAVGLMRCAPTPRRRRGWPCSWRWCAAKRRCGARRAPWRPAPLSINRK